MFIIKAKHKSDQLKVALAISIIRSKSKEHTLENYITLLASNFCKSFVENREQIANLKLLLIESKRDVFYLEHRSFFPESSRYDDSQKQATLLSTQQMLGEINKKVLVVNSAYDYGEQFFKNLNFISNIAQLKTLEKNFRFSESNSETILESLMFLFKQISQLLLDQNSGVEQKFAVPIETLFHCMQLFVNIYEVEWFYYLRDSLLSMINTFLKSIMDQYLSTDNLDLYKVI